MKQSAEEGGGYDEEEKSGHKASSIPMPSFDVSLMLDLL